MTVEFRIEKLIRDRIPEIMRAVGKVPEVRQVDEATVGPFVALKVVEEAFEVLEAFTQGAPERLVEELADVVEVIERLMKLTGISWEEVRFAQAYKTAQRGAFEDNVLLSQAPERQPRLYSALDNPLLQALKDNLTTCTRASLAVSFVMRSGVELLGPSIAKALGRGAHIRLLTSDYLDITEPDALADLLGLPGSLELRAYQEPSRSYHPKAYIFEHPRGKSLAFIGSSNLSASALQHGVEWNYEIHGLDEGSPLAELSAKFDALFYSPHSVLIDQAFIETYRARRRPRSLLEMEAIVPAAPEPCLPRPAQLEALAQLEILRAEGERKALVIAATGIGKTYLAAFDSLPYGRVLFVAHRDELLEQACESFQRVRPDARAGFYRAGIHDTDAALLFASIHTLGRPEHLRQFAPDHFDYIVVDEFHHAAAKSYRAVLQHFSPRFLLGLTATPYRGDNRDVFALCDGNVAYRVTFIEAIAFGWLCPFHYHGLYDETDYTQVAWRNGRYDADDLNRALANQNRATAILRAYREHPSRSAVGFCASIEHAAYMAAHFQAQGIPAQALHSGLTAPERAEAMRQFRQGHLRVLFTVDLFNEGVDVPEIDLVMFLRPTESITVFLQQLGRGLRLSPGKSFLTVLDFIGNYKRAHYKLALIAGQLSDDPEPAHIKRLVTEFVSGELTNSLPPGVELHFDWQAIDLMKQFAAKAEPRRLQLSQAFDEVAAQLERRPQLLELHRLGRLGVRVYRQEFGSWFAFLQSVGRLSDQEEQLAGEVGEVLLEVEKTAMTKSYKMVILQAFLEHDGLRRPVPISTLVSAFRAFFSASPRHARDLEGTAVAAIATISERKLRVYLEKNPLAAWANPGAKGQAFFSYDSASGLFSYQGPHSSNQAAFADAILERSSYRLAEYFEARFERK